MGRFLMGKHLLLKEGVGRSKRRVYNDLRQYRVAVTGDVLFDIGESIISCPNGPAFEPSSFKLPCKIDEVVHPIYDIL